MDDIECAYNAGIANLATIGLALVVALGACQSSSTPPADKRPRVVSWDPTRTYEVLRSPVISEPVQASRTWATALVPNARGGWNFITQAYEYESANPTEFVVLDLETGNQTVSEGPTGIYTNTNYQFAEQARARNGRVFLPQLSNWMSYYDPVDEQVKSVGRISDSAEDKLIFRVVFGPDGKLYGGTQTSGLPMVFSLDPDTLESEVIGRVGNTRNGYSYAYYLAADPPWLYVAVGQSPWELFAIHMKTHETRLLATRADGGFMRFDQRAEGITAKLISYLRTPQQQTEIVWCADGKMFPFDPRKKPPFKARNVFPVEGPVVDAPEIDRSQLDPDSAGVGHVRWRAKGTSSWRDTTYKIRYTTPIEIESLVALPDGSLLGNAKQYHGFFRYNPADKTIQRFGAFGISGGPRARVKDQIYFSGYPNSSLYVYDPTKPWSAAEGTRAANPRPLGFFTATGTHYPYFLLPSAKGRIYFAGRRERAGSGGGIGYYDPKTETFAGHHQDLSTLSPQGLAVLDGIDRVVYSGRVVDDLEHPDSAPAEAQLLVYDLDLKEVGRMPVLPDLQNTGLIYATPAPSVILGVVASERLIYQFDIRTQKLVKSFEVDGEIGAITQRASDRSVWAVIGDTLRRIDPTTLDVKSFGRLTETNTGAGILEWQGDRLFWATTSQLREITAPE